MLSSRFFLRGAMDRTPVRSQRETSALISSPSRRTWIQRSGIGIAALLLAPPLRAEEQALEATIRSMAMVTGTVLSDSWLQPTAELVGIIVSDSQSLRALDLGSIEPATYFKAD